MPDLFTRASLRGPRGLAEQKGKSLQASKSLGRSTSLAMTPSSSDQNRLIPGLSLRASSFCLT